MNALKEIFALFGFEYDKAGLAKVDGAVAKTTKSVDTLVGAVAGIGSALAGLAVVHFTNQLAEQLDVLDDLSAQTGVQVGQLQLLDYAARVNGSSAEEMNAALNKLQINLGNAATGGKEQTAALTKMGVAFQNSEKQTRPLNELLPEILDGFGNIADEGEQAAAAQAIFGRAGTKLLPLLRQGKEGIAKLRAEFAELGGGATEEATQAAGAYRDSLVKLDVALFSLKSRIATAVFPWLERTITAGAKIVARFNEWQKSTSLVENGVVALAGTVAVTLGGALAPYLGSGIKFAAIFLAIDDLIGFLQGKDSVIGDLLNRMFGEGTAEKVRASIQAITNAVGAIYDKHLADSKNKFQAFVDTLADPAFWQPIGEAVAKGLFNAFLGIGDAINTAIANQIDPESFTGKTLRFFAGENDVGSRLESKHEEKQKRTTAAIEMVRRNFGDKNSFGGGAHPGGGGITREDRQAEEGDDPNTAAHRATMAAIGDFGNSLTALISASKGFKGEGVDIVTTQPRAQVPLLPGATTTVNNYVEVKPVTNVAIPPGTAAQQARDLGKAAERGAQRASLAALERTR